MNKLTTPSQIFVSQFGLLLSSAILIAASGCGRAAFIFENDGSFGQQNPPTVCVPFDPTNPGTDQNGLAGKIKYLDDNQSRVSAVDDLLNTGHDAGVNLILNDLNVPEVKFTAGFMDSKTGVALKRSTGDVLNEWFAIDVRSELILDSGEADDFYQLALISDDGSILNIDTSTTSDGTVLINNDGTHASQMGCSSKAVKLSANSTRPIRVKYYQGPREHIALALMWRKVSAENSADDALCGTNGVGAFWDSNVTPSAPTANYNALISRGWKVPKVKNFILPADVRSNPCASKI